MNRVKVRLIDKLASGDTLFSLQKNGILVQSINVLAATPDGTEIVFNSFNFNAGDKIMLVADRVATDAEEQYQGYMEGDFSNRPT
jgi:hypothetical protein